MRRSLLPVAVALGGFLAASPAAAQDASVGDVRSVEISYEVGPYDPASQDWGIVAVVLRGDLDPDEPVNVELWAEGQRLWAGITRVTAPETRLPVDDFVAIGDLVEVGIWQPLAPAEDFVILSPDLPEPPPNEPAVEPAAEVGGIRVPEATDEVLGRTAGGGSGQLALAMILVAIVLVIVFRTPLPSATSQRWTK
jgi:hypothetical protein